LKAAGALALFVMSSRGRTKLGSAEQLVAVFPETCAAPTSVLISLAYQGSDRKPRADRTAALLYGPRSIG